MKISDAIAVRGHGGGGDEPDVYVPVESENTLQANTKARILDVMTEGVIKGPAIGGDWYKSTFFNETPVAAEDGSRNYEGVTLEGRLGTASQDYIPGFDQIEAETPMNNVEITQAISPVARTISNQDLDDVRVTLEFPRMVEQNDKGDLLPSSVSYRITVTPENGTGDEQIVVETTLSGKCTSPYRKQHLIRNLSQYGALPWVLKVYRMSPDASGSKTFNAMQWYSFTEVVNVKMRHPHTVLCASLLDAKLFGDTIPSRAWYIEAQLIKYPSNYDPVLRSYSGVWDGTFLFGYCNNPAWVVYYMIVNDVFGISRYIPNLENYVDKWELYVIGQYCDVNLTYKRRTRNPDGTYSTEEITRPRFTFNGTIETRAEALAVITHLCSVFMGFPVWGSGMASFVQDRPREYTRVANPANVKDGRFVYAGTGKRAKKTVARVSYNDPNNFGRKTTILVVDEAAVLKHGYNVIDLTAYGCDNPEEATYRGRFHLYTNNRQTDQVSFVGGAEWADAFPGEIIGIQDPKYANINLYGRIAGSTETSITADRDIEIEAGVVYTILLPDASSKAVYERELTNTVGSTNILTWADPVSPAPGVELPFVISSSFVAIRSFEVLGRTEKGAVDHEITAIEYSLAKFDEIEQDLIVDAPEVTNLPTGKISPPSAMSIQPHSYLEGDHGLRKYGLMVSWTASEDPRATGYEVLYSLDGGEWVSPGPKTIKTSYDIRDVVSGEYDVAVRAKGISGASNWVYFNNFTMVGAVDPPAPPTDLVCVDNPAGDTFSGTDCEISWTASIGSTFTVAEDAGNDIPFTGEQAVGSSNILGYKIEVLDGASPVRTKIIEGLDVTAWTYTLAMNKDDHDGSPVRNINFKVWTIDVRGELSQDVATLSASNPAPDMSGITPTVLGLAGFIDASWPGQADNDMVGYQVLVDDLAEAFVHHPETSYQFQDVEAGVQYSFQIVPYDEFGPGVGSQTSGGSPAKIPAVNIDSELMESLIIEDSDGNDAATVARLYNGQKAADGVSYTVSGTDKHIQFRYAMINFFDRISVCVADDNCQVYVGLSTDAGLTLTYLKADADHTIDSTEGLSIAVDQAEARANYWQLSAGENIALFPNNLLAGRVLLFMTGDYTTTIFEIVPSRMLISEMGVIKSLSVLTQVAGLITAGRLQSKTGSTVVDLDNDYIQLGAGSTGYNNLDDKPDVSANWSGVAVPALDNYPAVNWETDEERNAHLDDTYLRNGKEIYQFSCDQNTKPTIVLAVVLNASAGADSITALPFAASAVSSTNYTGGAYFEFKVAALSDVMAAGLSQNPTADNDPASIEFAWHFTPGSPDTIRIIESGALTLISDDIDLDPEDVFFIHYNGTVVTYGKNDTVVHTSTAAVPANATFYIDSHLGGSNDQILSIKFASEPPSSEYTLPAVPSGPSLNAAGDAVVGTHNEWFYGDYITMGYVEGTIPVGSGSGYSSESYTGACLLEFKVADIQYDVTCGISQNPTQSIGWSDIEFGLSFTTSSVVVRESGSIAGSGNLDPNPDPDDLWSINYDGSAVTYFKNRQLVYTSQATIPANATFYMDSYLISDNERIGHIMFGHTTLSPPGWIPGVTLSNVINTSVGADSITADPYVASAVSTTSYTGECLLEFSIDTITAPIVFGLSQNPTADNDPDSIEFGWEFTPGSPATIKVIESGTKTLISDDVDIDPEDRFAIHYDGTDIKYYKSQTLVHTSTATIPAAATFLVDSHLLAPGDEIAGISFWPEAWDYYDPYYGWKLTATNDSDIRSPNDSALLDPEIVDPARALTIGDLVNGPFCRMDSGDLSFFRKYSGVFEAVKSLKQVDVGKMDSGVWHTIEGRWANPPTIFVGPVDNISFHSSYFAQSQKLRLGLTDIELVSDGIYRIKGDSFLESQAGSTIVSPGISCSGSTSAQTSSYSMPSNTRKITFNGRFYGYCGQWFDGDYNRCQVQMRAKLVYYTNGGWQSSPWTPVYQVGGSYQPFTASTPTESYDITQASLYIERTAKTWSIIGLGNGSDGVGGILDSMTCSLAGGAVITTGKLGYIPVGE